VGEGRSSAFKHDEFDEPTKLRTGHGGRSTNHVGHMSRNDAPSSIDLALCLSPGKRSEERQETTGSVSNCEVKGRSSGQFRLLQSERTGSRNCICSTCDPPGPLAAFPSLIVVADECLPCSCRAQRRERKGREACKSEENSNYLLVPR
jgi:hypothetical protein